MDTPAKKRKGFASMPPEKLAAVIEKAKIARAANKLVRESMGTVNVKKDAEDAKLDYFQYSLDPKAAMMWEHDETVSPLHVPKEIKDRYPGLEWRFISNRTLDVKGKGYNGWEIFSDPAYPQGLKRGPDLRLAAMPKEYAERYRNKVSERSTEQVRNLQYGQISKMEQAVHDLNASGVEAQMLSEGETVTGQDGRTRKFGGAGISIGRRPVVGRGGNYQRGLSRSEVHEIRAKAIEESRKQKSYVFMGK